MDGQLTRRDLLIRGAFGVAGFAISGIPELWALQEGEELVEFLDYTNEFKIEARQSNPRVRCYDLRRLTSWTTPNEEFYVFHQTETVQANPEKWRLRIGGLVERPREFTLEEVTRRPDRREEAVTLECSGNSPRPARMQGLLSNAVWTGVGLASILKECGVKPEAREVVFLGMDMEKEKKWQAANEEHTIPHGRSVYIQDALNPEAMLAFEMNGKPLPAEQGFPLRLILPGWYGMTQIKWLTRIEVIDRRYEGQHMARNYLSLRGVPTPEGTVWLDTSISKNNLKSVVARVTRRRAGSRFQYRITGVAWGGQVPVKVVEVQIDGGQWRSARIDDRRGKYAWLLWSFNWQDATPGEHTLVSRSIDANGKIQPTLEELRETLRSGRENNSQWPRQVRIS